MAVPADEQDLWRAIHRTPIIDNHAHPLLKRTALSKHPLLSIATEANGAALESSRRCLAHLRVVRHLAEALGIDAKAGDEVDWDTVEAHLRKKQGDPEAYETWIRQCLEGIECVLVDDGLDGPEDAEAYGFFDGFTRGRSKRIVRLEPLVQDMIEEQCTIEADAGRAFDAVVEAFQREIDGALEDPEVVGFKSVICYRTGLAIPAEPDPKASDVFAEIHQERNRPGASKFSRLQHPKLNEFFVHQLARAITNHKGPFAKPIQFHTGLGDNDITLSKSSPAHMQDFIRAYPDVPLVLLHASYPFTRDLGYLASVYANVYADVGEVFPFVSREGQEAVVRQILELTPASKILWSTDGHWFPETYLLAVVQVREVLWTVLREYVRKSDMTVRQAVRLVQDVFFHNSNKLYDLKLELQPLPVVNKHVKGDIGAGISRSSREPNSHVALSALSPFLGGREEPRFLRVYWTDMTGMTRTRAIPLRRVLAMLDKGEELSLGVTKASLGLTQLDVPVEDVSASGEYRLQPDMATLRSGPRKGHLAAIGNFKEADGAKVPICPRTVLQKVLDKAQSMGITFTLGFEIELVLMKRDQSGQFQPLQGDGHAWCTGSAMDSAAAVHVVEEAVTALDEAGIYVDMVHPESADGQYEIVLPKTPALEAVDTLLFAREVISYHATSKGYRMTLHPKPFAQQCGTASHMHMSLSSLEGDASPREVYEPFYAGLLQHLPAVSAYTLSTPASYERAVDSCWAGGTWVAWGTQNRETPLRKVEGGHWEVKCIDGTANPYLSTAAVLAGGLLGIDSEAELSDWTDCGTEAPAGLTEEEREELGVVTNMPTSCEQAWSAMRRDGALCDLLGRALAERYITVKVAESAFLKGLEAEEQRQWMIERY